MVCLLLFSGVICVYVDSCSVCFSSCFYTQQLVEFLETSGKCIRNQSFCAYVLFLFSFLSFSNTRRQSEV